MNGKNRYGITVSTQDISPYQPINLRGSFEQCTDIAKKYGYDAIEIQQSDLRNFDPVNVADICRERALAVCGYSFTDEMLRNGYKPLNTTNEKERMLCVDLFGEYIDIGAVLGAKLIFASIKRQIDHPSEHDISYLHVAESLREICARAEKKGVTIAIEATNRYVSNWMISVEDNVRLIKDVNSPALELLIDTHHMYLTERSVEETIDYCRDYTGYVHLGDSNRSYLGAGKINFLRFMRKMMSTGYDGYYVVENMPVPDQETNARVSVEYIKSVENALRALPEFS